MPRPQLKVVHDAPKGRGGALRLDKSYNFVDKRPVIDQLRTLVGGDDWKEVADAGHVGRTTIYNWFMGKTISPRVLTVNKVLEHYGKCLVIGDLPR